MIAARLIDDLRQAEADYAEGLQQLEAAGSQDQESGATYQNPQELAQATLKMATAIGLRTRATVEIIDEFDKRISALENAGSS